MSQDYRELRQAAELAARERRSTPPTNPSSNGRIEQAPPMPVRWEVVCPACGAPVACQMAECDDGATWVSRDDYGDPYVTCECGAVIDPSPVLVMAAKIEQRD